MKPPENCPNCGADVPRNARACPECGADEHAGWEEDAYARNLDLPDESFDYDEFVQKEFGRSPKPQGLSWFWWIVGIVLILAVVRMFVLP